MWGRVVFGSLVLDLADIVRLSLQETKFYRRDAESAEKFFSFYFLGDLGVLGG
jgi:hypothetical protein